MSHHGPHGGEDEEIRGMRSFDPVAVGRAECAAWAAYYRHEWLTFLRSALTMVAAGFGMGPVRTVRGAWHVLQANRAWAPYPDNRPDLARAHMRRFYQLVLGPAGATGPRARRRAGGRMVAGAPGAPARRQHRRGVGRRTRRALLTRVRRPVADHAGSGHAPGRGDGSLRRLGAGRPGSRRSGAGAGTAGAGGLVQRAAGRRGPQSLA